MAVSSALAHKKSFERPVNNTAADFGNFLLEALARAAITVLATVEGVCKVGVGGGIIDLSGKLSTLILTLFLILLFLIPRLLTMDYFSLDSESVGVGIGE